MTRDYDLLCIGSGPAGQRAAVQAAKLGRRAAVVEKRRIIGGVCLDTGTIPSKTMREAVLEIARRPGRGRVQARELLERIDGVIGREAEVIDDQLARNGVDLLRGRAEFVDAHTVRIESETGAREVTADHTLVAVGTTPVDPPGGIRPGLVITSDEVGQLQELPHRLAVLGLESGLDYFLKTVFNYPTLAECYKVAALDAANKLALGERLDQAEAAQDVPDLLEVY